MARFWNNAQAMGKQVHPQQPARSTIPISDQGSPTAGRRPQNRTDLQCPGLKSWGEDLSRRALRVAERQWVDIAGYFPWFVVVSMAPMQVGRFRHQNQTPQCGRPLLSQSTANPGCQAVRLLGQSPVLRMQSEISMIAAFIVLFMTTVGSPNIKSALASNERSYTEDHGQTYLRDVALETKFPPKRLRNISKSWEVWRGWVRRRGWLFFI